MRIKYSLGFNSRAVIDSIASDIMNRALQLRKRKGQTETVEVAIEGECGEQGHAVVEFHLEITTVKHATMYSGSEEVERYTMTIVSVDLYDSNEDRIFEECRDTELLHRVLSETELEEHQSAHSA